MKKQSRSNHFAALPHDPSAHQRASVKGPLWPCWSYDLIVFSSNMKSYPQPTTRSFVPCFCWMEASPPPTYSSHEMGLTWEDTYSEHLSKFFLNCVIPSFAMQTIMCSSNLSGMARKKKKHSHAFLQDAQRNWRETNSKVTFSAQWYHL